MGFLSVVGVFVVKQTIRIYYTLIGQLFSSSYQNFSVLTLSVIADAMPPLPKGEALAVPIRMLKSVYFFLFLASSSIRAIWSSGVVQVPTG